jgi:RHS repeat-associated protein
VDAYWYQDNAGSNSHTATNTYDNVNRLTSAVAAPFGTGTWSYNLNFSYTQDGSNGQFGNMTCVPNSQTVGPCTQLSFNGNNQINSTGYTYGLQGNLTADGVHTYAYDAEGNLNSVDSGSTLTEAYNALGWRVEASNASGVVDYLHDAAGEMIGGSFTGGSNQYIYFRGGLMAQYWNGASFAHLNGLGSTQQFTDWTGANPVDTLFYPWGQPVNSSVESLWAGFNDGNGWLLHEWQTDTRRYTQSASRWFTPDPLGGGVTNPQSLNRYAYVLNNPMTLIDPTGLVTIHGPGNPPGGGGGGCDPGDPSCDPDPSCDIDFVFCGPGNGDGGVGDGSGGNVGGNAQNPPGPITTVYDPTAPCGRDPYGEPLPCVSGFPWWWFTPAAAIPPFLIQIQVTAHAPQPQSNGLLARAGNCALGYYGIDPLSVTGIGTNAAKWAVIGLAAGGIPKSILPIIGVRATTFGGASPYTGILSILSGGAGTAASGANWLRIAGRYASRIAVPVAIASVVIDAAAIGTCTALDQ